jgi:hypothetical protein
MDPVLFVRQAAHFQSMELERAEAICGFESSSLSRLWGTRGDCAGSQEVAVFGLGLSRDISTDKRAYRHQNSRIVGNPSLGRTSRLPVIQEFLESIHTSRLINGHPDLIPAVNLLMR